MDLEHSQKTLIDPYRTLGIFISGPLTLSKSSPPVLTVPTGSSFRVYSSTLAMKVVSPPLGNRVNFASSYNEFTYIRVKNQVLKMKYHHVVQRWKVLGQGSNSTLLCFDKLVVLAEGQQLTLIDEENNSVKYEKIAFEIKGMVHPVTYVNKLLLYSDKEIILMNAIAGKILYNFNKLAQLIQQAQSTIIKIQAAPLVDIAGVALSNGAIAFVNLKKDQIVFSVRQKLAAECMAFSAEAPWMATGDAKGNVLLWDLESKRILYKFQNCFEGSVDSLVFMPGMPVLTCGSSQTNSIKQLRINTDDNKILTLLRERIGCTDPLQSIIVNNSNQLILSSSKNSMFMAFHSQCNNYLLPKVLDSKLPFHIIARNFNLELWKERTLSKTFKLHQYAIVGKISLSNRYYIVATAKRVVKVGGSYEVQWKIPAVKDILLYNEHSIYAITDHEIVVCDFNTSSILARIPMKNATASTLNVFGNLMALYSPEEEQIEIWDMNKVVQGRIFPSKAFKSVLHLSFTADNRYLLSSHRGGSLVIWNVVQGEIYKQYELGRDMVAHCFTPDNQFMLSIYREEQEVCVWNNYLGKLSSNRQIEELRFVPEVREVSSDFRKQLTQEERKIVEINSTEENDVLDTIPDADDEIVQYAFGDINKWMPLVFYDEIKARNTPETPSQSHSMPFFLDFRNLTEQKKKIQEEIRKETLQKKKQYLQEKDKHLKSDKHAITLTVDSLQTQFMATFIMLNGLSVAEADYQIRSFLLTPNNGAILLKMLVVVMKDRSKQLRQQIKNIIVNRVVALIGTDLMACECVPLCQELLPLVRRQMSDLKQKVDRCITIADHHLK